MARHPLTQFSPGDLLTAPSILAADFTRLGEEIAAVVEAGADMIHVDIMDGHFVPNLSMGPPVVKAVRGVTDAPFDVHLMLSNPGDYIESFLAAGADHITIHVESNGDLHAILREIRAAGCSNGITLRPGTPTEALIPYLAEVDMVLVMTVEPGFGGQSFRADQIAKIREIRQRLDTIGRPVHLQVDGGLNADTARQVVAAGTNVLVAGSSVFRAPEGLAAALQKLRNEVGD
ncbi:MAG: ribulose-phosphate 3-epimerase [Victivallales bacterium]|jgi:ribulose-phosphate 3-epimerase|nr:ribulose-phosphate 3-epimerase [Victivallales bacterium]MBT7164010.1 ribulose-phosphate 3-epimerase [Victivallales bacterium]